jgi:hypothetical protein
VWYALFFIYCLTFFFNLLFSVTYRGLDRMVVVVISNYLISAKRHKCFASLMCTWYNIMQWLVADLYFSLVLQLPFLKENWLVYLQTFLIPPSKQVTTLQYINISFSLTVGRTRDTGLRLFPYIGIVLFCIRINSLLEIGYSHCDYINIFLYYYKMYYHDLHDSKSQLWKYSSTFQCRWYFRLVYRYQ